MKKNKKPVIIVAAILSVLILSSIILLMFFKKGSGTGEAGQNGAAYSSERPEAVVDFELRQLAEKAKQLVNDDLAAALRQGDVPIDFVSALREDLTKADKALSKSKVDAARGDYTKIVATAENRLKALEFAKSARELKDSAYTKLAEHEYLKTAFENTYDEAVNTYNHGLQSLESGEFEESIDSFETTDTILKELKEQSVQQVKAKLEAAESALSGFDSEIARASFERVLEIDSSNLVAKAGLSKVEAMEAIANEMESINSLRKSGDNKEALVQIKDLIAKNPDNAFLLDEQKAIEAALVAGQREAALERADAAEADGDLLAAIAAIKEANKIRKDDETTKRLSRLQAEEKKSRLELSLETGYNALKAGNYEAAKTAYETARALDPQSEEARTGLEKTSSLYLANIRYNKSIESSAKYLDQGRVPLATKFFNEALESRPSNLSFKQKDEEERIRNALAAQKAPVIVRIVSDGKTYVSLIGVFAPERFKVKEVSLYPDVYTLKGTRSSYQSVEKEVKVNKSLSPGGIEVICMDKL